MIRKYLKINNSLLLSAGIGILLALNGCSDSGGGGGTETTTGTNPFSISGNLTYDFVPINSSNELDYANTEQKPIRWAKVSLLEADNTLIQDTTSDATGDFSFSVTDAPTNAKIRVYSQSPYIPIIVEDNTNSDAVYAMETSVFTSVGDLVNRDINAASGWSGTNSAGSYATTRVAASFAILDSMLTASLAFLADRPNISFPELKVNWSIRNIATSGNKAIGQIGTSHWDGSELYILGYADNDTDEYDNHVNVHEWGHYFESKLGRSDSIGGSHSAGDILDPRVAFGEGWGNAISAITLYPDYFYRDTYGTRQQSGFSINMETSTDPTPGYWSEASIQQIIYDIFDATNDGTDSISLSLGEMYDILVGTQKTTPALTTIFSFIDALKDNSSASVDAALDALVSGFNISSVTDEYGSGETHHNGYTSFLPIYTTITIGNNANIWMQGVGESAFSNRMTDNRYIKFVGDGNSVTITVDPEADVDIALVVYENGTSVASVDGYYAGVNETASFNTTSNSTYVIVVRGYNVANLKSHTVNVDIQ
jgi:hypothetical protein